ncbi:MAG TPA: hypothetical protein VFR78_05080 [Pyrinomonadaceae bacterium]|nr:hypothetical protein [Pyrinomonadaceae bacterium]
MNDASSRPVPSLQKSILVGGIGFMLVSLCVFATVAYGERWMYTHLTLLGAYLAWTALFIVLGGAVLGSLVVTRWRLPKFILLFGLAFFLYAAGWVFSYFNLQNAAGEWIGSLAGSVLMAVVFAAGFGVMRSVVKLATLLFVANSAGYFLGAAIWAYAGGEVGMLLWGVVYGFFLGAGLGAIIHLCQHS